MKILHTYVMPRPFNGYNIPIAIQSSYLKDYAYKNNFVFSLPETELTTSGAYSILCEKLSGLEEKDSLAFTSIFMLPIEDDIKLKEIFSHNKAKNISFHFVLENKILLVDALFTYLDEIRSIINYTDNYDTFLKYVSSLK